MTQNITTNKRQSPDVRNLSFQSFLRLYRRKMKKTIKSVSKQDVKDLFHRICGVYTSVYSVPGSGWNVFWKHDGTVDVFTVSSKDGIMS